MNNDDVKLDAGAKSEQPPSGPPAEKQPPEEGKVISETLFRSPKGNVYRIIKTNEVDDYERQPKPPDDSSPK